MDDRYQRAPTGCKAPSRPTARQGAPVDHQGNATASNIKDLKKQNTAEGQAKIAELSLVVSTLEAEARELNGKAQSIEDAAYDLKAVNPNFKSEEDTRTPEQLLDFIELKGQAVAEALAALRELTSLADRV